jgi:3-hydroxyacyl-CoA dehydrogenase/enoyl-CoA hydratase/3-hydroxybutyryl-CoA epimerase
MTPPDLTQFRIERQANDLIHLIFDCPGRTMNVFSNVAIHELGAFAEWLHCADVRGVVIQSGKPSGFCAGADLTELGLAYDMIIAAPPADRFDLAYSHFFPLSHAIRRLETAGKPVAAAISGVALGGGCELAMGAHYRVATTSNRVMLGLPECGVGLLPGAGGTQRMPRLVGPELGLDMLLLGRTLQNEEAKAAGLVNELAAEGEEVAAAEAWLLSDAAHAVQPWDQPGHRPRSHNEIEPNIQACRTRELRRMLGHEPAPLAILDCVELGLVQPIDGAIRSEMSVFAQLIQRPEPRNMIRAMFLGKKAYEKSARDGSLEPTIIGANELISAAVRHAAAAHPDLEMAGFAQNHQSHAPVQDRCGVQFWICTRPDLTKALNALALEFTAIIAGLSPQEVLQLDHSATISGSIPAYLGGVSGVVNLSQTIALV